MTEKRSMSRFRRGAGEFLIIFVGVVLALAADDLRETRSETEEAEESLALVLADLMADSADFASVGEAVDGHVEAAAWLVERWEDPGTDPDSAELALRAFVSGSALQLNSSAFEGLRNSNRLRLIRKDSVRAAILRYFQFQQVAIRDFNERRADRIKALIFEALPRHVHYLGGEQDPLYIVFRQRKRRSLEHLLRSLV